MFIPTIILIVVVVIVISVFERAKRAESRISELEDKLEERGLSDDDFDDELDFPDDNEQK